MESLEEDAGAATNASRRASARERDVGAGEDGGGVPRESSEPGAASGAASGSEEAFDADSVPSPSQDVNTSTEAILDMIDEIVEGPDALRRRSGGSVEADGDPAPASTPPAPEPPSLPAAAPPSPASATCATSEAESLETSTHPLPESTPLLDAPTTEICEGKVSPPQLVNNASVESQSDLSTGDVSVQKCSDNEPSECLQQNESAVSRDTPTESQVVQGESSHIQDATQDVLPSNMQQEIVNPVGTSQESDVVLPQSVSEIVRQTESPQASSSVASNEIAESAPKESPLSATFDLPSNLSPNIPSISVTGSLSNELDSSENQISERTLKCVTSSDNRDNVTVESAESTSSELSARDNQVVVSEPQTRSPLRKRLVRPAPSDRRPDSTVSSSVDSQTNVDTTAQTSESVTKDVSSSSDAVSSVYCNVKPEEIRSVSEISVCKAETSMSPPKKIKLIRQRITPLTAQKGILSASPDNDQCQSTSSECTPSECTSLFPQNIDSGRQGSSSDRTINVPLTSTPEVTSESENEKVNVAPQENLPPVPVTTKSETERQEKTDEQKKVPPIKLSLNVQDSTESKTDKQETEYSGVSKEIPDSIKQVPKLTIKLGNKQTEGPKSPIPKLTIKPIKPPESSESDKDSTSEPVPSITKLNIKPIPRPPEKINDTHRKSSSSEISESESSENDESNSTSDQASNSDQGPPDVVPKVTIKVGKPGTESEGKFYTEQNVPKQENTEQEAMSKMKHKVSQSDDTHPEKIPKLTIKTVVKSEGQPLSPKLTIKPIKPPEKETTESSESSQIPKLKITAEIHSGNVEARENAHVPRITIKPVVKTDCESTSTSKVPKKSSVVCDSPEHIPIVTKLNIKPVLKPNEVESIDESSERIPVVSKLNIKPIVKPVDSGDDTSEDTKCPIVSKLNIKPIVKPPECGEKSESSHDIPVVSKLNIKPIVKPVESDQVSKGVEEKVPVVSKLNIKPVVKPKDNDVESNLDAIPKIKKLNIKPIKNPEVESSENQDCDVLNTDMEANSIPVVTKLNIKPIVKPVDEDAAKDSENQSSETGNSSDDNADHIPVVTKLNIKPIIKPILEDSMRPNSSYDENIPVITKLNIKPLVKPEETKSPSSPKKDSIKITKLNIKPVIKPEEVIAEDKNPPLVMKINMKDMAGSEASVDAKINNIEDVQVHLLNNVEEENIAVTQKINIKPIVFPDDTRISVEPVQVNCKQSSSQSDEPDLKKLNCVPELKGVLPGGSKSQSNEDIEIPEQKIPFNQVPTSTAKTIEMSTSEITRTKDIITHSDTRKMVEDIVNQSPHRKQSTIQNCTLLKKLLETKKDGLDKRLDESSVNSNHSIRLQKLAETNVVSNEQSPHAVQSDPSQKELSQIVRPSNEVSTSSLVEQNLTDTVQSNESLTKPLEISISDKISNQSSGQDSPRIILKINKTDHGPSAKIITEERPATPQQNEVSENTQEIPNDKQSQKRVVNSRKKSLPEKPSVPMGKRLRSSRIVEEKSPNTKRNTGKRPSTTETSPVESKEPELSTLESKRLKLGQLLSNKALSTGAANPKAEQTSPATPNVNSKMANHSLLNNENCSKNGNSKLHNILSNLQAKQAQALALNELSRTDKTSITPDLESNTSTGSSDVVEVIIPVANSHEQQAIIISDDTESRELPATMDESARDPLEMEPRGEAEAEAAAEPEPAPTPKRRGRPRKVPQPEGARPIVLPVPALEERPQRSLRLSRDRPTPPILTKGRGRGRGRGARRAAESPRETVDNPREMVDSPRETVDNPRETVDTEEDPTSSRVKLPRMTEALDKLPSTPLSSRRRSSERSERSEPKVVLSMLPTEALRSPETPRRGRGSRGGRVRTPRGRGRGGGRGATYMKETMGIYGRVCGPATTTVVEIFEEETCMMDDNATPPKLATYDEDSQSSVMSSTNDSNKMRKSKFADLFDSNKVWTAADVKEYTWPPPDAPDAPDAERQVMMIQEQVAMFLGVKSFKRRYPELKRRPIAAEERDYVLSQGLVTEALCDLGITAVDASEVLDIMLSDYPHKYEEYRAHQRTRQLAEARDCDRGRVEVKAEVKVEAKPEVPKVDLEKARQEAMSAAIASASEFNSRLNTSRRKFCVDLQTNVIHCRRPATRPATVGQVEPPSGFYPHSLILGQYQDYYRRFTPEQLRCIPMTTVLDAPARGAPPSSDSEPDWGSSASDASADDRAPRKRKKLTKTKRSSQAAAEGRDEAREETATCRACKLRLEANKRHTHERFLVCSACRCNLHPNCVELSADTIRRAREYPWQCDRCKTCGVCERAFPTATATATATEDAGDAIACQLCDRRFHIACLPAPPTAPSGRWHCVECAVCKSCGARSPSGPSAPAAPAAPAPPAEEATWHHQTKRGPGGHKVYSHSLCTPCARAFRIGRYCPLCERSFIGPKGTMQLVICKLCDRQHHQDCVKATGCALNVLDYTCGECRRGGITSRAAAARLAPRTIATLFMAKRRFNKYAHRQFLQRKQQANEPPDASDPEPDDTSDPLEGAGDISEAPDEAAAAVEALRVSTRSPSV